MAETNITVDRDYVDNFSIKGFAIEKIMPTYFPDQTPSNLTIGAMGMMAEYISVVTEDSFNTGSSLVTEAFPTRAKMESSIYSNAAIFQLSNAFAEAGRCDFMIVVPEADIQRNFVSKQGSNYKFFYIGRDTKFIVDAIQFTLDYDIEIRGMYRETEKGWVYSAKYIIDDKIKNSVSDITDPYIKLRKTSTGLIALQVTMKQYSRSERYESVVDNATLNYASMNVSYSGKLLGFDVLYKAPGDSDYNTQLETKVLYSLPSKNPFCYFKMTGENSMEISFTTNGSYFQPKFNSELKIIIYTTLGVDGNFDEYVGSEITISKGELYEYPSSWLLGAKPMSGCVGGKDPMSLEGLQRLTVEGFSTANSLTTENDLQMYFNNYKYRYDNEVLFKKKRNDAVELLFSAFMFLRKDNYIYPTNTLTLDSNILNFDYKDGGFYVLDPGYLFGYKGVDAYRVPVYYLITDGDGAKYDIDGRYINSEGEYDSTQDILPSELRKRLSGGYLTETDHSYYRLIGNGDPMYYLYDEKGNRLDDVEPLDTNTLFAKFANGELTYDTVEDSTKTIDFIIDNAADAEARLEHIKYYELYKEVNAKPDLTIEEYLLEYSFKDYKFDRNIDFRRSVFNTDVENFPEKQQFMFTNPFILSVAKETGLITYYQSFVTQDSTLDFINENDEDSFTQFVTYTLHVERDISEEKKYHISMTFLPSVSMDGDKDKYISTLYDESNTELFTLYDGSKPSLSNFKKELLINNRLRAVLTFIDNATDIGYLELIPTAVSVTDQITFEAEFYTDDFITTANTFRTVHKCPHCGHIILNSANFNIQNNDYYCDQCMHTFKEGIINIRENDSLLIPISGANIKITTIFKDPENDLAPITDNEFAQYDSSYNGYIWTNIYNSLSDPITFIEPLNMMRSSIMYKDYYLTGVDPLDCTISDIPLLKYAIIAYKDEGMDITDSLLKDDIGKFQYFMKSFLSSYDVLKEAKQYLNGTNIDMKFYNTYGRSTNFMIGEDGELIDTNNISIAFDVWVMEGTDVLKAEEEIKLYIKDYIEKVNNEGSNNLYISNLIRRIENDLTYVHHLVFRGINDYDVSYQSIINKSIDFADLTKEERRNFVPDLLVINTGNIKLSIY